MKFILFDVKENIKTAYIVENDITLKDNSKLLVKELVIPASMLDALMNDKKGITTYIVKRKFKKCLFKILDKESRKWQYTLSKNFNNEQIKYLKCKLQEYLGYMQNLTFELDGNVLKYVERDFNEKKLNTYESKALIICKDEKNINFVLIKNLVKEFKELNIYLNDKPSKYIVNKLEKINKQEGSTISILSRDNKSFKEYNLVYFIDALKKDFPRFRFGKQTLILDQGKKYDDEFNSNIVFLDTSLTDESKFKIEGLIKNYGKLNIAIAIRNLNLNY